MNLSKLAKEYFLGTETREFYRKMDAFSREMLADYPEKLKQMLKATKAERAQSAIESIVVPNMLRVSSIVPAVYEPKFLYGLVLSEGFRVLSMASSAYLKKTHQDLMHKIVLSHSLEQQVRDTLEGNPDNPFYQ